MQLNYRGNHGLFVYKNSAGDFATNTKNYRTLLGFDISYGESDYSWYRFLNHLKERGLNGLKMVISVAHAGLVKAIKETFINVSWQRCQVHFLRNILDKTPKNETKEFKEDIKALFRNQDIKIARIVKKELFNKYEDDKKYQASLVILDKGF